MSLDADPILKEHLWVRPDSYGGYNPEGHACILGRNRDSDLLAESNWYAACRELGADPEHTDEEAPAYTWRAGHWAVGWVEYLMIRPDAPEETKRAAAALLERLSDYPVLDEEDLSEREFEAAHRFWDDDTVRGRAWVIKDYNERHHWVKVPLLAARHSLHRLSELYPDLEQWICEMARS